MAAPTAASVDAAVRASAAAPNRRARPARSSARVTGGVAWITVVAVLLAGVVAINVSVLRLNVRLSEVERQRASLHAENARLAAQLSTAATPRRIEQFARLNGLVPARSTVYISLTRER